MTALTMLGYTPYHMAAAFQNASIDFPAWEEALKAKYAVEQDGQPRENAGGRGNGPRELAMRQGWGRAEFDKLLADFDAVLDVPCVLFVEELLAAYPDAKVIITERPVEGELFDMNEPAPRFPWNIMALSNVRILSHWMRSIQQTVAMVWSWNWLRIGWAEPLLVGPFA